MAIAPEQIGIGIRRHYGPDVHRTTWSNGNSEARIQNYKDGTDVLPARRGSWPPGRNATNIVARSTSTSAPTARRRCAVIDRIADNDGVGHADGYFVDDIEGAGSQRAEILPQQRAKFNSPVWFNIGVQGVPQQASARFILAVEDTMDGISTGTARKARSSRAGRARASTCPTSAPRSSTSRAGTASGPVSFMRGAGVGRHHQVGRQTPWRRW
jgi:ribonucleoside-diphosphate reductase alpha chain